MFFIARTDVLILRFETNLTRFGTDLIGLQFAPPLPSHDMCRIR